MSGITPILDTLLHQVLGKRVDVPVSRPLNEPVKPLDPAEALRAVHSDSRLDARQPPLAPLAGATAKGMPREQGVAPPAPGAPSPSTSTHFSPAATTIADILVKFPAPPSVIKPVTPLMPTSEPLPSAPLLASRLQASIGESGVFYESHLSKWFRGEFPRQALEHEPQMWRTQALRSSPVELLLTGPLRPVSGALPPAPWVPPFSGNAAMGGGEISPRMVPPAEVAKGNQVSGRSLAVPTSGAQMPDKPAVVMPGASTSGPSLATPTPAGSSPGAMSSSMAAGVSPVVGTEASMASLPADPVSDALQGIVRHQLEMLVTPVLRWEGDVWSGIFMALMVQVPEEALSQHRSRQGEEESDGEGKEEQEPAWHSEMTLRVESLGTIGVSLRLKERRLALTLTAESTALVMRLEQGQVTLKHRLERCGLDEVALRVNLAVSEGNAL
ncbi:hypothetical protein GCM10007160_04520 [Litchfieldella qijiaojingensis]|uniref:Flagellar hook-length control protein-like C-terminal domain-containing protein n=1 Tax=Litchfieldella qijiaojingensis TaxID=980347 RepID=A0ABQ2YE16_9GAMM|nr:flagellar hook-length control protein FliK [Halomonas qijiaojingensis]GGX80133.1 hypothetical protein GCM10007160_04520 [Halomonas qijiaojingensis]